MVMVKTKTIREKTEAINTIRFRFKRLEIPTAYVSFVDEQGKNAFLLYDNGDFLLYYFDEQIKILNEVVVYTLLERMKQGKYTIIGHGYYN